MNKNTETSGFESIYVLAQDVYKSFLKDIIIDCVFSDAERSLDSFALTDKQNEEVCSGIRQDIRPPYLCRVSAKGGWTKDTKLNAKYQNYRNVSLLDHLTSVVRGAITFASLDLSAAGYPKDQIEKRLALIAAVAFSHDIDKVMNIQRPNEIEESQVSEFMSRFGYSKFLTKYGIDITSSQLVSLIDQCETNRAGRIRPNKKQPSREAILDCAYVQVADQMDSAFLDSNQGIEDALEILKSAEGFRTSELSKNWRNISINEPNCPFLLDKLLRYLSSECRRKHGHPPLIEIHHDGCLTCIVPTEESDEIINKALDCIVSEIGGKMRVDVNARGTIDILDKRGTLEDLQKAIARMPEKIRFKLLQVRTSFKEEFEDQLDEFLSRYNILPTWPKNIPGQLVPMWQVDADDEEFQGFFEIACQVAVTLCCRVDKRKLKELSGDIREAALNSLIAELESENSELPGWLSSSKDSDRKVVLAFLAAAIAVNNDDFKNKLLGKNGLCRKWLEGDDTTNGLASVIESSEEKLGQSVLNHFKSILKDETIIAENENAEGRCHFTNAPVAKGQAISERDGIYALKISAFSGREGRPEYVNKPKSETLLSPIAKAEHKLRSAEVENSSLITKKELPVYISSPTTAGLFGALVFEGDGSYVMLYDLLHVEKDKKTTFNDEDALLKRVFVGRFDTYPNSILGRGKKEKGQISFVIGVLRASLRLGRAMHVYKGMPSPSLAFVYFDTLPQFLEVILNGNNESMGCSLRIEQIKDAIHNLEGIEAIATTNGFGLELAKSLANPDTRFAALCDVWARSVRTNKKDFNIKKIEKFSTQAIMKGTENMTESDKSIVAFAEAVAQYQKKPNKSDGTGVAVRAFRIALEQCEILETNKLASEDHLIAAIAGSIQEDFERGDLTFRKSGEKYLQELSEIFVRNVWKGAFNGTSPSSKLRRSSFAIFRWSFLSASNKRFEDSSNEKSVDSQEPN